MKNIVITGSGGFVGSHLVQHILEKTGWNVIGLESFKHRGDSIRCQHSKRLFTYTCDIAAPISQRLIDKIHADVGPINYIINMASQSHVDRSIEDPVPFVQNNVNLALYMLEFSRAVDPEHFIQISTDEVYGPALEGTDHKEWSEILPSNPYSASKAAQEAICISYWRTYGVPLTITNTMNMIGERQDPEKYIPMCISKIAHGETVSVHGSASYIGKRHYLHARNHADALLFILENTKPVSYEDKPDIVQRPARFNIVGDIEMDNLEMASEIADIMGKELKYKLVDFHAMITRPGHDRRYSLDGAKIASLGWKAPVEFYQSLENTVKWYLDNPMWLK